MKQDNEIFKCRICGEKHFHKYACENDITVCKDCCTCCNSENTDDVLLCNLLPQLNITMTSAETKRLISNGCISINNEVIEDINYSLTIDILKRGINIKINKKDYNIQL